MGDESKMNFTPTPPTEPGAYLWKTNLNCDSTDTTVAKVYKHKGELMAGLAFWAGGNECISVEKLGGWWSERLEPVKPKCSWSKQPHDTLFKTACGVHKFLDPGSNEPASNFYCSNCGGEIEIKP